MLFSIKNEIMLFAGRWIKQNIIMLSEARLRRTEVTFSLTCGS
jgi:hypothetical protein